MKRSEPLILTFRFLVFDRKAYRTKMSTVIRLNLRTANRTNSQRLSIHRTNFAAVPRTDPHQNCGGTVRGPQI